VVTTKETRWIDALGEVFLELPSSVFNRRELWELVERERESESLGVPPSYTPDTVASRLVDAGYVKEIALVREDAELMSSRNQFKRYIVHEPSSLLVGLSLRAGSYLSHTSAVFLHRLTDLIPRTVYANKEQTPKPAPTGPLRQPNLDRAFRNAPRRSTYVFSGYQSTFVLLSGKHSGDLGVNERSIVGETLRFTDLERTLIDIVVRPHYAGGLPAVLEAFRAARDRISVNKLQATLSKLDHKYPYHQSIGFLLQLAGVSKNHLRLLKKQPMEFDFYLAHGIRDTDYDEEWRLYFPRGFKSNS